MADELSTEQIMSEFSKGYRAFKAFEKGNEVIAKLAGIEQTIKEKTTSLDVLKAAEAELREKCDKVAGIIDSAKEEAASLLNQAKGKAQQIEQSTAALVKQAMADLDADRIKHGLTLKAISAKVEAAQKEHASLMINITSGAAELDKIADTKKKALASLQG